mmetsp:Transcript_79258/g.220331  ORF Transcript_79258/g.220331 Transcript_79258/m.220331 type:complete len:371 (-) Transcript_79258:19-1131(-)
MDAPQRLRQSRSTCRRLVFCSFWRRCFRCPCSAGGGHSVVVQDEACEPQTLDELSCIDGPVAGTAEPHNSVFPRACPYGHPHSRSDSEDEGFLSAREEEDDESHQSSAASPPAKVAPDLPMDATEDEVAAFENLRAPSVTPAAVDEICAVAGLDGSNLACRLTARRFAVAHNGDVQKAAQNIKDNQAWLEGMRPRLQRLDACGRPLVFRQGWDRLGHPLLIWNGPQINAVRRSPEEVSLLAAAALEEACAVMEAGEASRIRGMLPAWRLQKVTMILFLPKGSEPDIRQVGKLLRLLQNQYPERLYKALIFPVGRLTPWFWSLVKPFLDARTTSKLVFLQGGDAPRELQDHVAPEQLPSVFGGTLDIPLPS